MNHDIVGCPRPHFLENDHTIEDEILFTIDRIYWSVLEINLCLKGDELLS